MGHHVYVEDNRGRRYDDVPWLRVPMDPVLAVRTRKRVYALMALSLLRERLPAYVATRPEAYSSLGVRDALRVAMADLDQIEAIVSRRDFGLMEIG
jgi:hypothetical protein